MANKAALEIWKYTLPGGNDIRRLEMPQGARVLSVGEQGNEIKVWVLCRPTAPRTQKFFLVLGTGRPFMDVGDLRFIGTVLLNGASDVWHVFEVQGIREPEKAHA